MQVESFLARYPPFSALPREELHRISKAILRVHDRDGYWWVDCASCEYGWQVPYYAAESAG